MKEMEAFICLFPSDMEYLCADNMMSGYLFDQVVFRIQLAKRAHQEMQSVPTEEMMRAATALQAYLSVYDPQARIDRNMFFDWMYDESKPSQEAQGEMQFGVGLNETPYPAAPTLVNNPHSDDSMDTKQQICTFEIEETGRTYVVFTQHQEVTCGVVELEVGELVKDMQTGDNLLQTVREEDWNAVKEVLKDIFYHDDETSSS